MKGGIRREYEKQLIKIKKNFLMRMSKFILFINFCKLNSFSTSLLFKDLIKDCKVFVLSSFVSVDYDDVF